MLIVSQATGYQQSLRSPYRTMIMHPQIKVKELTGEPTEMAAVC
jgi:hypothetical protein